MNTKKVWLITGASKGLGLALAKKLLAQGYKVAATSRSVKGLEEAIGKTSDDFFPLAMEITNEENVANGINHIIQKFGAIDIVVNNAGYGQLGTLEEITDAEVKENFDVNVYGSLNVIRAAMPFLRKQKSGAIFNISSVGGFSGNFPGWGIYCSTKFAVAGFTEALAAEAASFGVSATVVYPGYFRTEFLTSGSLRLPAKPIAAYETARASEKQHTDSINGQQPGDPEKAADVLIATAESERPPVHLFLGQDAYDLANAKMEIIRQDMKTSETSATATQL